MLSTLLKLYKLANEIQDSIIGLAFVLFVSIIKLCYCMIWRMGMKCCSFYGRVIVEKCITVHARPFQNIMIDIDITVYH